MRRVLGLLGVTLLAACSSGSSADADATTSTAPVEPAVVYPGAEWERADPEELGFDPAALEAIAATAEAEDSDCLVVTRRGRIVGEWYWNEYDATTSREVFSVTKSVTSTLVGIAQADGALAIDDPASDFIDEWRGTGSEGVSVRNLLSMDSGREWSFGLDYTQLPAAADRTQFSVDLGQDFPPGEGWSYNNAGVQDLDRVISGTTGGTTRAFAAERLFGPLGMTDTEMTADASGNSTNTFFGTTSTCEDLARFGYLFLRDGMWDGEQVVPSAWVAEATGQASQEHNAAYGLLWWLNRRGRLLGPLQAVSPVADPPEVADGQIAPGAPDDMFTAQGAGGQIVMVDPGSETVIVRLGDGPAGRPLEGFRAPDAARVLTEALVDR